MAVLADGCVTLFERQIDRENTLPLVRQRGGNIFGLDIYKQIDKLVYYIEKGKGKKKTYYKLENIFKCKMFFLLLFLNG